MLSDRDYIRNTPQRGQPDLTPRLPKTPLGWVIFANISIFILQQLQVGFHPVSVGGNLAPSMGFEGAHLSSPRIWTLFTHQFVHVNLMHLLVNLLMIWFTGRRIQGALGARAFLSIYLLGGIVGALLHTLACLIIGEDFYLCGASGSAYALLIAYAVLSPDERIFVLLFFIIPVSFTARTLAIGLVVFEFATGSLDLIFSSFDTRMPLLGFLVHEIAHFAHLGGALLGYLYMRKAGYGRPHEILDRFKSKSNQGEKHALQLIRNQRTNNTPKAQSQQTTAANFISSEIDPILDKINEQGFQSLTAKERSILEEGQKKLERRPRG
jgi:membrane associated rhomboid family serine protease